MCIPSIRACRNGYGNKNAGKGYQQDERTIIGCDLREKFSIQSENVDDNTEEKEFIMVWNRQI